MTTTAAAQMPGVQQGSVRRWSLPALLALWVCSGLILLLFIGNPPVSRTQEARVLETARQMLGSGAAGWITPQLNGEPRLAKPPLSYWMTAAAYRIAGHISEGIGRVPVAFIGWLTIGLTFVFAKELFDGDERIALASSAAMLGSLLFFKSVRLAETDAPAMFFVTLAVYAIWRASALRRGNLVWLHLAAASIGIAALAKGGPAAFPLAFLVAFVIVERRWDLLRRLVTSGAVLTAIILAGSWFAFIAFTQGTTVFRHEASDLGAGRDHPAWFIVYIPWLLRAAAPWSGVLVLAMIHAARQWKLDARLRMLLVWTGSILLPLCLIGQKQNHYLVPILPPVMILVGYLLITWPGYLQGWLKLVLAATYAIGIAGVLAVPLVAFRLRGHLMPVDWTITLIAMAILLVPIFFLRTQFANAVMPMLFVTPLIFLMILDVWWPTVPAVSTRTVARQIQERFGAGPYLFAGANRSYPLCFNLRSAIPSCETAQELRERSRPGTIVIAQTKNNTTPPPLPAEFVYVLSVPGTENQKFDVYRYEPAAATTTP